jgi:hypothetical protein
MRKHLAVAGAAALSLALAAPAAAEPFRSGKFRVELKGVQTTTWEAHHATQFECDVNIDGSGTEKVRFRSRPAVVSVRRLGRSSALIMRGRDVATLDLDASITRQGSIETRGGAVCSDGDGGGDAPAAPDCGAKRSRLSVELRYLPGRRQLIGIQPDLAVPLGPFATCPVGGTAWPLLLDRSGATGRPVGARLPVDDLFRHGKNIVIARGREVQEDADDRSTTAIRWELSFTRMGSRGRRPGRLRAG